MLNKARHEEQSTAAATAVTAKAEAEAMITEVRQKEHARVEVEVAGAVSTERAKADLEVAAARATSENLARELERSKAKLEDSARQQAQAVAHAIANANIVVDKSRQEEEKKNSAAKNKAKADIDASRERERALLVRLREIEVDASKEQETLKKELDDVREACAELEARAKVTEEEAREELSRGKAKLAKLIQEKDDVVGGFFWEGERGCGEKKKLDYRKSTVQKGDVSGRPDVSSSNMIQYIHLIYNPTPFLIPLPPAPPRYPSRPLAFHPQTYFIRQINALISSSSTTSRPSPKSNNGSRKPNWKQSPLPLPQSPQH